MLVEGVLAAEGEEYEFLAVLPTPATVPARPMIATPPPLMPPVEV
jgi:hypothetical protein